MNFAIFFEDLNFLVPTFLGPFAESQKKPLLASSGPHVDTRQIYAKFNVGDFKQICGENLNLVKVGENIRLLHEEKSRFYCCRRHQIVIKALCSNETVSGSYVRPSV
jgi:hypothetical protein